jgi:hypothetical protein
MTLATFNNTVNALPGKNHIFAFRRMGGRVDYIGSGDTVKSNTKPVPWSIVGNTIKLDTMIQHPKGPQFPVYAFIDVEDITEIVAYKNLE